MNDWFIADFGFFVDRPGVKARPLKLCSGRGIDMDRRGNPARLYGLDKHPRTLLEVFR